MPANKAFLDIPPVSHLTSTSSNIFLQISCDSRFQDHLCMHSHPVSLLRTSGGTALKTNLQILFSCCFLAASLIYAQLYTSVCAVTKMREAKYISKSTGILGFTPQVIPRKFISASQRCHLLVCLQRPWLWINVPLV